MPARGLQVEHGVLVSAALRGVRGEVGGGLLGLVHAGLDDELLLPVSGLDVHNPRLLLLLALPRHGGGGGDVRGGCGGRAGLLRVLHEVWGRGGGGGVVAVVLRVLRGLAGEHRGARLLHALDPGLALARLLHLGLLLLLLALLLVMVGALAGGAQLVQEPDARGLARAVAGARRGGGRRQPGRRQAAGAGGGGCGGRHCHRWTWAGI